jgi:hypothetical protein
MEANKLKNAIMEANKLKNNINPVVKILYGKQTL